MVPLTIRPARRTDLGALARLLGELGYPLADTEVASRLAVVSVLSDHRVWVAAAGDSIIGFLHAFIRLSLEKPRQIVVQSLVVEAAERRGGTGGALMAEAERWSLETGCTSVALYTRTDRADAHAFYERLGYRISATSDLMVKVLR